MTTKNPITTICEGVVEMQGKFAAVLPSHIPMERFERAALTAIQSTPNLATASRQSIYNSLLKAAQDGLVIDGREAALVIYNVKGGGKIAQYMPMVAGVIKKVRNSGQLATISAHVVHEADHFDYELGDDEGISHRPAMGDRGNPIAAYAIAKLKDGSIQREVMSVIEIEEIRASSRAKSSGPWVTHWSEMARKTVIRRLAKYLPQSSDLDIVMADDVLYDTAPKKRASAKKTTPRPKRLEKVAAEVEPEQEEEGEPFDSETGELVGDRAEDQIEDAEIIEDEIPI